jgi:hypothetical protein
MNGIRVVIAKLLQKQVLHEPHTTTKRSTAELMFGRKIRSRLNIMRSNIQQEMNLNNFGTSKKTPSYVPEQPVQIRFYDGPCKKFGTVVCQKSQLNYAVLVDGTEHIRHVSQMRSTGFTGVNDNNFSNIETATSKLQHHHITTEPTTQPGTIAKCRHSSNHYITSISV